MTNTIILQGDGWRITRTDEAHTSVPYGPTPRRDGQLNHGYMELCDHPERVAEIPEAQDSIGMQAILRALAHPGFRFMSLGCGRRALPVPNAEAGEATHVCDGYVQLAYRDHALNADPERLIKLAQIILSKIGASGDIHFQFEMIIEPLRAFFGHGGCYCLMVQPRGYARSEVAALVAWDHAAELVAAAFTQLHGTPSPSV
jgi:hypothetical protein